MNIFNVGDRVRVNNYNPELSAAAQAIINGQYGTVYEYDGPFYDVEMDVEVGGNKRWLFYPDEITHA